MFQALRKTSNQNKEGTLWLLEQDNELIRFLEMGETQPKPLTNKKELHLVWLGGQNAQCPSRLNYPKNHWNIGISHRQSK